MRIGPGGLRALPWGITGRTKGPLVTALYFLSLTRRTRISKKELRYRKSHYFSTNKPSKQAIMKTIFEHLAHIPCNWFIARLQHWNIYYLGFRIKGEQMKPFEVKLKKCCICSDQILRHQKAKYNSNINQYWFIFWRKKHITESQLWTYQNEFKEFVFENISN